MATQQLFSVHEWLRAASQSEYEKILSKHGYNTYESCVNLSKADLLSAGVGGLDAGIIADVVEVLKAVGSKEDAVRELSVSV